MRSRASRSLVLALGALALAPPSASADLAAGVLQGDGDVLALFDTAAPGSVQAFHPITGLEGGDRIEAVDFRFFPGTAEGTTPAGLFGLGVFDAGASDSVRLYVIDPATGAATAVGPRVTGVPDATHYDIDFDTTVDRIRMVNDADANYRLNPNTGALAGDDSALNPSDQLVEGVAYDRVDGDPATSTTAYVLATANETLRRLGGMDKSPSPNLGGMTTVGPLSVLSLAGSSSELDIAPSGTAFATMTPATGPSLFTVNLASGQATSVGRLAFGMRAFAVLPAQAATLSQAAYTAAEGQAATITVKRGPYTSGSAIVDYTVSAGSAAGTDFQATRGTLTMAPGEAEKTFQVQTAHDTADEPDETLTVTLSNPRAPVALGAPAAATLTIADDDPTPALPIPPDTAAPAVTISVPRAVTLARLRKGLRIRLTPSEPAALEVAMQVSVRSARISANELTLNRRALPLAAGARTLTLKPNRALLGRPRRAFRLRLLVTATDAARNRTTRTRSLTVRVPRRR